MLITPLPLAHPLTPSAGPTWQPASSNASIYFWLRARLGFPRLGFAIPIIKKRGCDEYRGSFHRKPGSSSRAATTPAASARRAAPASTTRKRDCWPRARWSARVQNLMTTCRHDHTCFTPAYLRDTPLVGLTLSAGTVKRVSACCQCGRHVLHAGRTHRGQAVGSLCAWR